MAASKLTPFNPCSTGKRRIVEKLWRELFSDPSQWLDHRLEKGNSRYPDFKHKKTQDALWLNGKLNPPWVKAKLAAMPPGAVQLNSFSWNTKLVTHVKAGQYEKTLGLFRQMQEEDINLDRFTFVPVLNACASLRTLEEGRRVHKQIIQRGCESDIYVGSGLIDMYAKCGNIEDAWRVFNSMPTRDVVAWNTMIQGCVKCGQGQKALKLFERMRGEFVKPVGVTYVGVLNACADLRALEEGRRIHVQIVESGFEKDVYVGSSLVNMYSKCGSIADASRVFDKLPTRDVVSWNAMIQGYANYGEGRKALELSPQMRQEGVQPDSVTYVGLLNACASVVALEEGRGIHAQIIQSGCVDDVFVGSSLIDMYAKCGSIEDAWRVFQNMPSRNVVSWNAMIHGYVNSGQGQKALVLCQEMQEEGMQPDHITFVGFLNACASAFALQEGKRVHEQVRQRGCESDVFVGSSLIDMYAKCGSLEDAWRVFRSMPIRSVVSWNAMILGLVKCGQTKTALELSGQMQQEGLNPDPVTFLGLVNACASEAALEEGRHVHMQIVQSGCESNFFVASSLVDMYTKCGSIEDAWRVFNRMSTHDVVVWNAIILGFVKSGRPQKALDLSQQMQQERVEPDTVTFVGFLNACASLVALEEGRLLHKQIIQRGLEFDVFVGSSLVDMYAKCGSIEDARWVFDKLSTHNVVSLTAMLGGYAMHGHAEEALQLFDRMCEEGVAMNGVTFVSLLSACSHAGLVDEGLHYFDFMSGVHGISALVEHCACMVDLLGRAGRLHEAEDLTKSVSCEPNATVWMSLLGACGVHCNMEMGERIAKQVLDVDPGNTAAYVMLSNIYATACKWSSSANIQRHRLERHVMKQPW